MIDDETIALHNGLDPAQVGPVSFKAGKAGCDSKLHFDV